MAVAETRSAPGRVATNTIARAAGEVIAKVASLAFYVVAARELGSEDYGAFIFVLTLAGTLLIGAGFGTEELVAREVARERGSAGRYLSNVTALKAVTGAVLLALALAIVLAGGYDADTRLAALLVGLGVAAEVTSKSWHAIFQARERLALISACVILQRTLTAAVGIAWLLAGGGILAASAAYLLGALAGLVASELAYRRWTPADRPRPAFADAWALLRGGLPIGVAGLLVVILLKVDILLLSFLSSDHEVGIYGAAYRLIEGTQFIPWAFGAAMLPWLARTAQPARGYMLGLKLEAAVLAPLALVALCFAAPIIDTLYGEEFADGAVPLALLAPTIAFYGLQSLSSTVLIARDAPGVFMRVAGVVAVQNIACNAVAIPLWGADGAAAVALSSSVLLATLSITFAARRAGGLAPVRAFGGVALAGAALAAVALLAPLPALVAAVLALLAYAGVLAAYELALHREDVRTYLNALPSRFRRGPAAA